MLEHVSNPALPRKRSAGRRGRLAAAAVLSLPMAGALGAAPAIADDGRTLIDFTEDTSTNSASSFVSVDAPGVTFSEAHGEHVMVGDMDVQSHGMAVVAFLDLAIDFTDPISDLEFSFGNDDPFTTAGDILMTMYLEGSKVGEARMATNHDDVMNQTLVQSGGPTFDKVTIEYVNPDGSSANLAMIVDDIYVGPAVSSEPEPEPEPEPGACTIKGTPGDDVLVGTAGADVICGYGGDDVIRGGGGADVLRAHRGDDVIVGQRGDDSAFGGSGADRLRGGAGRDSADGGEGFDFVSGFEQVRSAQPLR